MLQQNQSPKTLLTLRIIWFALLFGPLSFLFNVIAVILPSSQGTPVTPQPILNWVCAGMLFVEVPIAFAIRSMVFRRGRVGDRVSLGRYTTGNIIFWAGCEGVAFFGSVIVMINRTLMPTLLMIAIAIGLQALTFPVGTKVLLPDEVEG